MYKSTTDNKCWNCDGTGVAPKDQYSILAFTPPLKFSSSKLYPFIIEDREGIKSFFDKDGVYKGWSPYFPKKEKKPTGQKISLSEKEIEEIFRLVKL